MDKIRKFLGVEEDKDHPRSKLPPDDEPRNEPAPRKPLNPQSEDDEDEMDFGGRFGTFSQLFINPSDLQKQIEAQLEDIMRQMGDIEGSEGIETFVAPVLEDRKVLRDEELKGEDFKRLIETTPFISSSPSLARSKPRKQISDDERVFDRIHGTESAQNGQNGGLVSRRNAITPYLPPGHPKVEIWTPVGPPIQGRGMFQGVITTTVRRGDGSTETKKITYDKEGNQTTTITTTDKHGNKTTETKSSGDGRIQSMPLNPRTEEKEFAVDRPSSLLTNIRRYLFVDNGYTLPKNLW